MLHRMNPSNMTYTHQEANRWLTAFMIDLKKVVLLADKYPGYQPFTMDRLMEWSKTHCPDVQSCKDWEFHKKYIGDAMEPIPEHQDAILCFNSLVIDLKLMLNGKEYTPISEDRITEADRHYAAIHDCKKKRTVYY